MRSPPGIPVGNDAARVQHVDGVVDDAFDQEPEASFRFLRSSSLFAVRSAQFLAATCLSCSLSRSCASTRLRRAISSWAAR